jgi:hypothetical protein
MKIPNFINTKIVNDKGELTESWKEVMTQLFTQLQLNVSDEGFMIPQQSSANVTTLGVPESTGAVLYDYDKNLFNGNINGTFQQIITSGDQQAANVSNIQLDNTKISNVGFYGVAPVTQQVGGTATAGGAYTANEQTMLNAVYTALRNYGLMS